MEKDNNIFLGHILENIEAAEKFIMEVSENDFYNNLEKVYAVIRSLEIIGEAARNLSNDFKAAAPHIAWRDISDFRNVLIHEYFGVDKEKVWAVVKNDLPNLKKEIELLLK